ncbi:hypothetical protein BO85DRAFT_120815 [Aspergillus piperis CBS 112811]|uniref:Uncharacterized protein n=1 Tax=Aspergillus piperis CBS 112811 TaxID=1448313 RepID=A0A8G1VQJ9_9EURO|nr:hypothetical protein BO85DRAFT_120815 [Aspergillus piperis CBS 112811]RAH61911.1 hypothetical protein BO85DRAFT_120815 [Aspergillus piperis CBS 112811]
MLSCFMFSLAGNCGTSLLFLEHPPPFSFLLLAILCTCYSLTDNEYAVVSHSLDIICGVDRLPTFAVMESMGGVAVNLNEQRARNPGIAELRHYAPTFFILVVR